jgi:hypothetical protein
MYCSLVVKGRVVPRESRTVARRQQYATPAATAGGGGICFSPRKAPASGLPGYDCSRVRLSHKPLRSKFLVKI